MSINLLVTGGRNFNDKTLVFEKLSSIDEDIGIRSLINGKARGLDSIAREWAISNGIEVIDFNADWNNLDKKAGTTRNLVMLQNSDADAVLVFPGGTGTANMEKIARNAGLPVWKVKISEDYQ